MNDVFYNYVYLDPRKPGNFNYSECCFDYEPFYVGKGKENRMYSHLYETKENTLNKKKFNKIQKIRKETGKDPIVLKFFDNLNETDALENEILLIKTIGRNDQGLGPLTNLTDGGEGTSGRFCSDETKLMRSKIVYQYTTTGELVAKYSSITEACNKTNVSSISACANMIYKTSGDFIWSFDILDISYFDNFVKDLKIRKVYQYDLNGNFIKEYQSFSEASTQLKIKISVISRSCNGKVKVAYNNFFSYTKLTDYEIHERLNIIQHKYDINRRTIYQFDLNGIFLKQYDSIIDAINENNLAYGTIINSCKGRGLFAGDFLWRYTRYIDMNDIEEIKIKMQRNKGYKQFVSKYNLDGLFIENYSSIKLASELNDIPRHQISECCREKRKNAGGFIWRYENDRIIS